MPPARAKLQDELHVQVCNEVAVIFPDAQAVSVYDVLQGFHADQRNKLIVAVETQMGQAGSDHATFETHVVKIGSRTVVAPDVGGAKMARGFANRLNAGLAIVDKRRPAPNVSEVLSIVGDVEGRPCLLADDMVDTGGTLASAVRALKDRGATQVYACATHALLSGSAKEKLSAAPLEELVVTNTIDVAPERRFPQLKTLSVASLLARAIQHIHLNESVSQLFESATTDD